MGEPWRVTREDSEDLGFAEECLASGAIGHDAATVPLSQVLATIAEAPWGHAIYAHPGSSRLDAGTPVLVWDVDDVDEDSDLPSEAVRLGFDYVVGVQDVRGVVANAREQRPAATDLDLLAALQHFLDRDAYVDWS